MLQDLAACQCLGCNKCHAARSLNRPLGGHATPVGQQLSLQDHVQAHPRRRTKTLSAQAMLLFRSTVFSEGCTKLPAARVSDWSAS